MTVAELLQTYGLPVDETELVAALRRLLGDRLVAADAQLLPSADAEFLAEHAGLRSTSGGEAASAAAGTTAALTALLEDGLTVEEAAVRLGISASRVRHRLAERSLVAVKVGRASRLPDWQFVGGRALPHLKAVLAALPDDVHPLVLAGFMTTPQPELELSGAGVTPQGWLAAGGDPRPVVALAESLAVPA